MAATTTKTATPKAKAEAKAASTTGVKKAGRPKGSGKKSNTRNAMIAMQAFCKLPSAFE